MIDIQISANKDVELPQTQLGALAEALRETCARFEIDAFVEVESTKTTRAYAGADPDEDDEDDD